MDLEQQLDMFVANILDVGVKGDVETMEVPIFALSTKPDTEIWRFESDKGYIQVSPSAVGRPTIFDKDLLMYCISQVVEGVNRGRKPGKLVRITAHDFLKQTGRNTDGRAYEALLSAAERLRGVTITGTYGDNKEGRRGSVKGLIDNATIVEKTGGGRMVNLDIELSDWIFEAVSNERVLTYHPSYYNLRKPNERRMYELCRKFCGRSQKWEIGFDKLYDRFGTRATKKKFKEMLKKMIDDANIPEYLIDYDSKANKLTVIPMPGPKPLPEFVSGDK